MKPHITTFLMFTGKAEEAMNFYMTLFANSAIEHIERYGPGELGAPGTVKRASFHLNNDMVSQAIDSKGGFTMVLASAKALLEHGVVLDLVRDQFPDGCLQ